MPITFGSLFAGIGGIDLGFERAGMECRWQVEIDEYARRVLAKHWPNVRRHDDVRTWPQPDTERVDVIAGGFPCQDISNAGKGIGLSGDRSGLFFELIRCVRILRPRVVVLENVPALLCRGMGTVLGELAKLRLHGEWGVLPACAFRFPHARERLFCLAYSDASFLRTPWPAIEETAPANVCVDGTGETRWMGTRRPMEPEPCSVAYGVPGLVDRLRGFGNAVVPDVAEFIGKRVVELLPPPSP